MTTESPLETAQHVWPGEWTEEAGVLTRVLFDHAGLGIRVQVSRRRNDQNVWIAVLGAPGLNFRLAQGPLEEALNIACWNTNSIAAKIAKAAGVTP